MFRPVQLYRHRRSKNRRESDKGSGRETPRVRPGRRRVSTALSHDGAVDDPLAPHPVALKAESPPTWSALALRSETPTIEKNNPT